MIGQLEENPLTARCDSSGSDAMLTGGDTTSPYSSLDNNELRMGYNTEPCNHDYANPQELKPHIKFEIDKIDGARKKRNLIYESTTDPKQQKTDKIDGNQNNLLPRPRRRKSGSDEALILSSTSLSSGKKRTRTLQCLVIAVFILSLAAVSLAIIAFIEKSNNGTEPVPQKGKKSFYLHGHYRGLKHR